MRNDSHVTRPDQSGPEIEKGAFAAPLESVGPIAAQCATSAHTLRLVR